MIKTILFDLDGTLLPMDQDTFAKAYFGGISKKAAPCGYEPTALIRTIWAGTAAMVKNDGRYTNEEVFWRLFADTYGEQSRKDIAVFDAYYDEEFEDVRAVCGYQPLAATLIHDLHARGLRVVLATNPIFPRVATDRRIRWAGLEPQDFDYYTTYENSHHCKPNPAYYRDILAKLGLDAASCLMVGNDVAEDMVAETVGLKVFLLTDCLINKSEENIDRYPHGDFATLITYLSDLLGRSI